MDGKPKKAKAVGIIHVALEVGNIAEALSFYGNFLNFQIERMSETAAFIYFGYQFLNFARVTDQIPDEQRHFGIAFDDRKSVVEMWRANGLFVFQVDEGNF